MVPAKGSDDGTLLPGALSSANSPPIAQGPILPVSRTPYSGSTIRRVNSKLIGVLKNVERKKKWVNHESTNASDLFIESFRIDQVPGTHVVKYESAIDDLEIKHIAHSREGFALGAVMVAEWVKDKKGVLGMDDFLKF